MKYFLLIMCFIFSACTFPIGDTCSATELVPYPEELLEGCNDKCCVWQLLDFDTGVMCDEMWCFKDCSWDMMHETCYQT